MRLLRGLGNIPSGLHTVATLGNFDGVHLGHQALLHTLKAQAKALSLPSLVIIFEPQPKEFFAKEKAPARLSNLREKLQLFACFDVDFVLCLPFNARLRALGAQAFIDQVLVQGVGVRHLIVGDDFRFGHDRSGDFALLQAQGAVQGFSVKDTATVQAQAERISSTRVRVALAQGDLARVQALLGRPYYFSGRVGFGRQLGRTLNTPTANILLKRQVLPATGVFAVHVQDEQNGEHFLGVASLGVKPTITAIPEPSLEVHLFDFNGNLYHRHLRVELVQKIRDEQKFASLEALKTAIEADKAAARRLFA
ncbi:MAG: hypothetical protein RL217_1301 [Pseudomonadota bacterium]|jgi:riboflavin kinase/FMN adenylyltransferase